MPADQNAGTERKPLTDIVNPLAFVPEPSKEIVLAERSSYGIDGAAWDSFSASTGASFLGSWKRVQIHGLFGRIRIFEFFAVGTGRLLKIGQCAIQETQGRAKFLDRLHLLPEHDSAWPKCMSLIFDRLGSRIYTYGSSWNSEPQRVLPSNDRYVIAESKFEDFHLDQVDLSQWRDFEHYASSISNNIRRDLKKARSSGATVAIRHGYSALRDLGALIKIRRHVMKKNKVRSLTAWDFLLHFAKVIYFGKSGFIATVSLNNITYSALFCTVFGERCYYISGGVLPNELGLGSFGMMSIIARWQARSPKGQFVMGYVRGQTDPSHYAHTEGTLLYRRKLRVASTRGCEFSVGLREVAHSSAYWLAQAFIFPEWAR